MELAKSQFTRFKARVAGLKSEYQSFEAHHRELSEFILPRLGRWTLGNTNEGGAKNGKIIDNTAKMALRVLSSGMMSGLTSPARPWFNLSSPSPELQERKNVKIWTDVIKKRMNVVLARSNIYDSLPRVYTELGLFGQGPLGIFDDFKNVIYSQTFTQGEYWIANDDKGTVNTFARSFRRTVSQVIDQFGLENVSDTVKHLYDRGIYDAWVDVFHIIEPNRGRDQSKVDSLNMPFRSVYWEQSSSSKVLKFSGYQEFPIFCPRWELNGGDVYASSCPAMDSLGDIKQLQQHEKRSSEAVDKFVRPSMVADPQLKNKRKSQAAGGVTYTSFVNGEPAFREAYKVNARINELEAKSDQIRKRINTAFYADLFLQLSTTDRRQITAREVEERHEEKLLMLGPVLERLNKELLDPLISRVFNIMVRRNLVPPPPEELDGQDLKIEYVSILHQAQRSVGVAAVERLFGFSAQVMQVNPASRHKINFNETISQYGEMLGTNPGLINSEDEVAALEKQEQQALQQQQALEQAAAGASIAKDLSQVDTSNEGSAVNAIAGGA